MENKRENDYAGVLEKNGVLGFAPYGNSMWPFIKNHRQSVVVVKKTQRLKPYDVALYTRADGSYVLHRVIKVTQGGYVMCGDSQFSLEPVAEDKVIGCMSGFYKGEKYIDGEDVKYRKKVEKWYARKKLRYIRLKAFYLRLRVKNLFSKRKKG